eukprot:1139901-Pleurochrysis_carterae.AAC.2
MAAGDRAAGWTDATRTWGLRRRGRAQRLSRGGFKDPVRLERAVADKTAAAAGKYDADAAVTATAQKGAECSRDVGGGAFVPRAAELVDARHAIWRLCVRSCLRECASEKRLRLLPT